VAYLRRSLTEPYGNEILFVGSGGIFEYRLPPRPGTNLNRELIHLLKYRQTPPPERHSPSAKFLPRMKRALKSIALQEEPDRYDVALWTIFQSE
jgi:hypothetical protein